MAAQRAWEMKGTETLFYFCFNRKHFNLEGQWATEELVLTGRETAHSPPRSSSVRFKLVLTGSDWF